MLTKTLLCAFALSAIFATCFAETYVLDPEGNLRESRDGKECTSAGFMCEDCSTSVNCYQLPNGTWVKEVVEDCSQTRKTCLASTGICTSDNNPECSATTELEFICNQPGMFPDPYDCQKYHICAPKDDKLVVHTLSCQEGYYFDAKFLTCGSKITTNCTQHVPTCTAVAQGPILRNRRMYYQCRSLIQPDGIRVFIPYLFYCPGNQRYLDRCYDPDLPYNVEDNVCKGIGFFPVSNCRLYNRCAGEGTTPNLSQCGAGLFFNPYQQSCDPFGCDTLNI